MIILFYDNIIILNIVYNMDNYKHNKYKYNKYKYKYINYKNLIGGAPPTPEPTPDNMIDITYYGYMLINKETETNNIPDLVDCLRSQQLVDTFITNNILGSLDMYKTFIEDKNLTNADLEEDRDHYNLMLLLRTTKIENILSNKTDILPDKYNEYLLTCFNEIKYMLIIIKDIIKEKLTKQIESHQANEIGKNELLELYNILKKLIRRNMIISKLNVVNDEIIHDIDNIDDLNYKIKCKYILLLDKTKESLYELEILKNKYIKEKNDAGINTIPDNYIQNYTEKKNLITNCLNTITNKFIESIEFNNLITVSRYIKRYLRIYANQNRLPILVIPPILQTN